MTRTLGPWCAAGGLVFLIACGSDGGSNTTSTITGGTAGTGGASAGGNGGSAGSTTGEGGSGRGGTGGATGGTGGSTGGTAGVTGTGGAAGKAGASGSGGAAGTTGTGGAAGKAGSGGAAGSGGTAGTGGASGSAGKAGASGSGGTAGTSVDAGVAKDASTPSDAGVGNFSFFVVSMKALQTLSGKTEGFGGDLRFGQADGLAGADEICRQAAELGMPGAGSKTWRAFLSVTQGPGGAAVNARDRIGAGPWYDRSGRLLSANLTDLFAGARPTGDAALVSDLTNERGEPNHYVGATGYTPGTTYDTHDTLTGSDAMGQLRATSMVDTCNDWTSTTATGKPYIGHSWPRSATNGTQWASDHTVPGCVAGIDKTLGGSGTGSCVGCAGGYGGFYCFAVP